MSAAGAELRYVLDGAPLDPERAWASLAPALRVGDGVFRTLRVHDGALLWRDDHVAALLASVDAGGFDRAGLRIRLDRTLAALQTDLPDEGVAQLVATPRSDNFGRAILTPLSVWSCLRVGRTAPAEEAYARGVSAALSTVPHPGVGLLGKTSSYAWSRTAMRLAYRDRVDEALLGRDGVIVEAATSAIVWREGDRWFGVHPRHGAQPSLTRAKFEAAVGDVEDATLTQERAEAADQLVLLSSVRLAMGVRSLGARMWGAPDEGLDAVRRLWLTAGA